MFYVLRPRILAILLVAVTAGCSPLRVHEAMQVLNDIQAGDGPSTLKETRPEPQRQAITLAAEDRSWQGDIYYPGDGDAAAAIVLVPGVTPHGPNDPRIVAFAKTLARARFQVVVPDLPAMRALEVTADDAIPIADAVAYLAIRDADMPIGIVAVSFAVGPAVLALFEPQVGGRVNFVVTIGGYYDLDALITYITTGAFRDAADQPWQFQSPKRYGKWVFVLSNASRIDNPQDRVTLVEMARRKLYDADAEIESLVATLGPEGQAVYALLVNNVPENTPKLIQSLPPGIIAEMARLDLKTRDVATLGVDFIIIHDRTDRIIPASHSVQLAAALPRRRAHLYLVDSLDHADPRPVNLVDGVRLLDAVYTVLSFRDRRS